MDRVSQAVKELVEEIQRMPEAPDLSLIHI